MRRPLLLALVLAAALVSSARAQTASKQLQQGIEAYARLDLETAARLLRRALAFPPDDGLSRAQRDTALTYLGAAELFRQRRDSSAAAFHRLVLLDPRYRPDPLNFPPPVLQLFNEVRRSTKAVDIAIPPDTVIRLGTDMLPIRLYASSAHRIAAGIVRDDGARIRTVYAGEIGDSLDLRWNGLDSAGVSVASGAYFLTVESRSPDEVVARVARLPLDIEATRYDTLAHLPPPADSLLLPERRPAGPALKSLVGGVVLGGLVAGLPLILGAEDEASDARFAVAGSITFAGLIGFFTQAPGQPLPRNVAANQALYDGWRRQQDRIVEENRHRLRDHRLRVRTGALIRIEYEEQ